MGALDAFVERHTQRQDVLVVPSSDPRHQFDYAVRGRGTVPRHYAVNAIMGSVCLAASKERSDGSERSRFNFIHSANDHHGARCVFGDTVGCGAEQSVANEVAAVAEND